METVIILPAKDEKKKQPKELLVSLDKEIFARFLGLYFMKEHIPEDIYTYAMSHECPSNDPGIKQIFSIIQGAPDENLVRRLVLTTLVYDEEKI
jgi:hypothetical protein